MSETTMPRKRKSRRKTNGHSNGHTALEDPAATDSSTESPPEASAEEVVTETPALETATETLTVEASPEAPVVEAAPAVETPASETPADLYPWPPPETPVETQAAAPAEAWAETALAERPFGLLARLEDPARNAIGWTEEHSRKLKRAKEFYELCLQVDREVLHLCAGILALHLGDFEVVAINFQSCGIATPQGRSG